MYEKFHLVVPTDISYENNPNLEPNLINSERLCNPNDKHTSAAQAASMHSLPQEYGEPFENIPRLCPIFKPEVETRDAEPVCQAPYRRREKGAPAE